MRILMLTALLVFAASPVLAEDESTQTEPAAATETAPPGNMEAADEKATEFKAPSGYKVKMRDDETVYCRKQSVLGSRFPEEYCFTQAQLEDLERRKRSIQQDTAQRQRMCTTGSACSGGG